MSILSWLVYPLVRGGGNWLINVISRGGQMPQRVESSVEIEAPVEKVYDY